MILQGKQPEDFQYQLSVLKNEVDSRSFTSDEQKARADHIVAENETLKEEVEKIQGQSTKLKTDLDAALCQVDSLCSESEQFKLRQSELLEADRTNGGANESH